MKKRSNFVIMARLIGLVRPLLGFMLGAITMGLIGHLCAAFITVLGGYALLSVLGLSALSLPVIFAALAVCALLRGVLRYAEQSCNHYIAFKLLALIRDRVFGALRTLCPAKLEGRGRGDLVALITSDIELLEVFYAHTISPIAIAVLFGAVMCLYIGSVSPLLGLLTLAAYVLVGGVIPLVISRINGDNGIRFRTQSGALSSFVLDSLHGLSETIQYGGGDARLAEMNARTDELSRLESRMKTNSGCNTAITNTAILVCDLAMLLAAARLCITGTIAFSGALLAVLALMSSFGPTVALANLGSTLQNTFAAGDRVLDILDEKPETKDVENMPTLTFDGAAVEHVTFGYGDETVLDDFSIEIPTGEITGIVGRSGSGKSTLLKLLMRFWDTKSGVIRVSGEDIRRVNTTNLRDMESYVTQETHLFHDSIANNLRIAKRNATQEELEAACKKAAVHDFIVSLPRGYDTPVGELGDTLSGGERQRLGLARAFLHDAPFLLLDEPTSNLDSLNEAVILKALHEQRAGRTVILISHRESTMRIADRVYTMVSGKMRKHICPPALPSGVYIRQPDKEE